MLQTLSGSPKRLIFYNVNTAGCHRHNSLVLASADKRRHRVCIQGLIEKALIMSKSFSILLCAIYLIRMCTADGFPSAPRTY